MVVSAPKLQFSPTLPGGVRVPDMMRVGLIAELDQPSPQAVLERAEQVGACLVPACVLACPVAAGSPEHAQLVSPPVPLPSLQACCAVGCLTCTVHVPLTGLPFWESSCGPVAATA